MYIYNKVKIYKRKGKKKGLASSCNRRARSKSSRRLRFFLFLRFRVSRRVAHKDNVLGCSNVSKWNALFANDFFCFLLRAEFKRFRGNRFDASLFQVNN